MANVEDCQRGPNQDRVIQHDKESLYHMRSGAKHPGMFACRLHGAIQPAALRDMRASASTALTFSACTKLRKSMACFGDTGCGRDMLT